MTGLFFVAFLGGFLTIAAPCILAVLPIILGSTIGHQSKLRPLAIVAGLTVSFTGFGLLFTYVTNLFGLSNNTLRNLALIFLALFGVALIFPNVYEKLLFHLVQFFKKIFPPKPAAQKTEDPKKGLFNAFLVGASLGLVWVPCAGPILGAILTLAVSQSDLWKVTLLLLAYSAGAGLPMLVIAYGGNFIVSKVKVLKQRGEAIKKGAGIFLLIGVALIYTGLDAKIAAQLAVVFPNLNMFEEEILQKTSDGTVIKESPPPLISQDPKMNQLLLPKEFLAPELTDTQAWINSEPLTLKDLKGKVVIVDFWTYSCINCVRTLPYLNAWHAMYKDQGLVILGVHTYEFAFEKELANVQKAVKDFGIQYPVVQDNNRGTWNAYQNRYWPAKYIVDKEGYIRYTHFGEGEYEETEEVIRALLAEGESKPLNSDMVKVEPMEVNYQKIGTPETYLGYGRAEHQGNMERALPNQTVTFAEPQNILNNSFYLVGEWSISEDYVKPVKVPAKLIMNYEASKIILVVEKDDASAEPATAKILLDGQPIPAEKRGSDVAEDGTVTFDKDTLYNLVDTGDQYERHTVTIEFQTLNVKPYVFTFG